MYMFGFMLTSEWSIYFHSRFDIYWIAEEGIACIELPLVGFEFIY